MRGRYMCIQLCVTLASDETPYQSALTLLVARVLADHHDTTVSADDLALLADPLNARIHLHDSALLLIRLARI